MESPPNPASALLADLARRGIELRVDGGRLRFRPKSAMTAQLAERVRERKAELTAMLTQRGGGDASERPPARDRFRIVSGRLQFGDVCAGWRPSGWARELRRMATFCENHEPAIAAEYRAWAADIQRRISAPPRPWKPPHPALSFLAT